TLSGAGVKATVNSSILGTGVTLGGGATCTSSFSRGPSGGSPPCGPFATSATPSFANLAASDYHLNSSGNRSLIEVGHPSDPTPPALDIDGQPRAIDFDGDCTARRDIGADEVPAVATGDCAASSDTAAPDTSIEALPIIRAKRKRVLAFFGLKSTEPDSTFRC